MLRYMLVLFILDQLKMMLNLCYLIESRIIFVIYAESKLDESRNKVLFILWVIWDVILLILVILNEKKKNKKSEIFKFMSYRHDQVLNLCCTFEDEDEAFFIRLISSGSFLQLVNLSSGSKIPFEV
uniref:Uncharacterized protein n=1 Tax=Kalanchoe fedtschenkoi TaxID=63787 RepID=A0A7N0TWX2_KALFE